MRNRKLVLTALVALVVIIFAGTGVRNGQGQIESLTNIANEDIAVVDYDAPPPTNPEERRTRESREENTMGEIVL